MIFVDHLLQTAQHVLDAFGCTSCNPRIVGIVCAAELLKAGWTDHETWRRLTGQKWLCKTKVVERCQALGTLR